MKHDSFSGRMLRSMTLAATLASASLAAQAALQARDYNLDSVIDGYYDTTLNITWAANANAAAGSPQDDGFITNDGLLSWANAQAWVAAFSPFGTTGWRLPTIDPACEGYSCSSSAGELGYQFYANLGGTPGAAISTSHGPAYTQFAGVQDALYWSSNTYVSDPEQASVLDLADGNRSNDFKIAPVGAVWAVASGDVLAAVPEPTSWVLMLAGLTLMGWRSRRQ